MIRHASRSNWAKAFPFIGVFAALGIIVMLVARAAGPVVAFEAESGTLSGNVVKVALPGASAGKVARFGAGVTPTPTATPAASSCLSNAGSNAYKTTPANGFIDNPTNAQANIYNNTNVPNGRVFDGTGTTYSYGLINSADAAQIYGIRIWQGSGVCWSGGRVIGTGLDAQHPIWETWHDLNGLRIGGMPGFTLENFYMRNFGDNINISDGSNGQLTQNFTIRDTLLRHSHDDCIQNDKLAGGKLVNSFLDGCYSGISARLSSSDLSSGVLNGSTNTFEVSNTLIWMQPISPVYKGANPGHGGFFKWENAAPSRGLKLSLSNVVLMARQLPNHQALGIESGTVMPVCQNVIIIWLGSGSFPDASSFPSGCATVVTGEAGRLLWLQKVNEWYAAHPQFADLKQPDSYYFSYNPQHPIDKTLPNMLKST